MKLLFPVVFFVFIAYQGGKHQAKRELHEKRMECSQFLIDNKNNIDIPAFYGMPKNAKPGYHAILAYYEYSIAECVRNSK